MEIPTECKIDMAREWFINKYSWGCYLESIEELKEKKKNESFFRRLWNTKDDLTLMRERHIELLEDKFNNWISQTKPKTK